MQQLYHPNQSLVLARKPSRMLLMVGRFLLGPCPQCPASNQTLSSSLCPRLLNMRRLTGKTKSVCQQVSAIKCLDWSGLLPVKSNKLKILFESTLKTWLDWM